MQSPVFYFNLRSPYSWLASRDLASLHRDVAEPVLWRPCWEPSIEGLEALTRAGGEFCYTPMSKEKHLYILQDIARLSKQRGLSIKWPIDRDRAWERAHYPFFEADRHGLGREYVMEISRLRWEEGRDITTTETLAKVEASLDLAPDSLVSAIRSPDIFLQATQALLAAHLDGVFGFPFFVIGRQKFWGIDRLPDFVDTLRSAHECATVIPSPSSSHAPAEYDDGHAGGCG